MGYVVGIDLGTTNSVVALLSAGKPQVIPNAEGSKTTPSVVLYNAEDQVVVGDLAKRQRMLNPARTIHSIKRFVGCRWDESAPRRTGLHYPLTEGPDGLVRLEMEGRELLPEAVQAEILIKLKRDAEAYLGEPVEQAVITCPAYFNDSQRLATKKAAELAGLEALRIVNEPTAAALAYGIGRKHSEKIAVFDFGGGTFDISILEINEDVFEVLATCGDTFLGGDRIDQLLTRWIADAVLEQTGIDPTSDPQAMSRIYEAAEKAKCELSTLPRTSLVLPFLVSDATGPKHFNAELSREQFETLIASVLAELEPPCLQAMQDAGLTADKLQGVVLVGGSTRIPAVQVLVQRIFGREPDKSVNPDEAVALGAAIQAGIMRGDLDEILLLDVTPLSLGIELSGGLFSPLIPRNSSIPTVAKRKFTTVVDNQTAVRIHVLQGERRVATENRSLGHFRLEGISPAPREVPEIEVSFNVDANGILSVAAMDLTTGALQQVVIESYQPRMDGDVQRLSSEGEAKAEDDRRFMRKLAVRQRIEDLRADLVQHLKTAEASLAENQERRLHEAYFRVDSALVREDWATLEVAERELKSIYTEIMMLTGGVAGKIADELVFENQPDGHKSGDPSGISLEIPTSN